MRYGAPVRAYLSEGEDGAAGVVGVPGRWYGEVEDVGEELRREEVDGRRQTCSGRGMSTLRKRLLGCAVFIRGRDSHVVSDKQESHKPIHP